MRSVSVCTSAPTEDGGHPLVREGRRPPQSSDCAGVNDAGKRRPGVDGLGTGTGPPTGRAELRGLHSDGGYGLVEECEEKPR